MASPPAEEVKGRGAVLYEAGVAVGIAAARLLRLRR